MNQSTKLGIRCFEPWKAGIDIDPTLNEAEIDRSLAHSFRPLRVRPATVTGSKVNLSR